MTAPWAGMADLRFAIRTLWRTPVFALGAVLTLALGIGANVAVFTFVKGLLLQPLPYPEPDRLVAVEDLLPGYPGEGLPVSYLNFEDWQKRQRVFSAMAVYLDEPMVLTGSGDAERSFGARASAGLFRALGVAPASGRTFTDEEDRLGGPPVAVISHGLWQQRFGGQPAVGRTLLVDDVPRTIVGVMPAGFDFPDATALWIPAAVDPSIYPRGRHSFSCLARLRDGVTPAAALVEMRGIAKLLAAEYRADNEGVDVTLRALRGSLVPSGASRGFSLLMGTVALVLLIACANLANLMLARAAARGQEMAIRSALGASRGRIISQALTESAVLAGAGMSLGLLAGAWGRDLLVALVPVELPAWLRFEIDASVAAFALALAAVTTLLVGLAPAIRSSRPAISSALAASGARVAGEGDRLRATLIVAEVALATVLLVGGGLMMRGLAAVLANDPGVRPANVWTGRLAIPPAKYQAEDRQRAFYSETLDRVRALPGVLRASAVSSLPMSGSTTSRGIAVEGRPRAAANEELLAVVCVALPDYFETIGIRLLRGRTFDARDGLPGTPPVAVVNATFVKRYLPPGDPIGRRVTPRGWNRRRPVDDHRGRHRRRPSRESRFGAGRGPVPALQPEARRGDDARGADGGLAAVAHRTRSPRRGGGGPRPAPLRRADVRAGDGPLHLAVPALHLARGRLRRRGAGARRGGDLQRDLVLGHRAQRGRWGFGSRWAPPPAGFSGRSCGRGSAFR